MIRIARAVAVAGFAGAGGVSAFAPAASNAYRSTGMAFAARKPLHMSPDVVVASSPSNADETAEFTDVPNEISKGSPLRVLIAGGGVGGLALANSLAQMDTMDVTVLERTDSFKRFGGPIQLASNALQVIKVMDETVFGQIMDKFTTTGDKDNGIKDGIRNDWYAKFDLASPAEARNLPYTGVIDRPDLQEIYLNSLPEGVILNGDAVVSYQQNKNGHGVRVVMESGKVVEGDVLIGADGIWSAVRANMWSEPIKGDGSGATYSGYTVFAGELAYDSFDNGLVGYKVYIGPGQYFVITDIGKNSYQWYAFLARPADSAASTPMPDGKSIYLQNEFEGWSGDIHHILKATQEHEIEQRDLYDRPPSVLKSWTDGNVALIGDAVHGMMPNLGQGGCQAIEDAFVLVQELGGAKTRHEVDSKLRQYSGRRLVRSAAVQGLSRFASDIIILGFDTPAKILKKEDGSIVFENFNYSGLVTKALQPILPVFFMVQFNFLYDGWKNEKRIDWKAALGFVTIGAAILLASGAFEEIGLGLGILGIEGLGIEEGIKDVGQEVEIIEKVLENSIQ